MDSPSRDRASLTCERLDLTPIKRPSREEAMEAVRSGRMNPRPLYTHRFSLDELGQALDLTKERPTGFMKALIVMGDR